MEENNFMKNCVSRIQVLHSAHEVKWQNRRKSNNYILYWYYNFDFLNKRNESLLF